MVLWVKHCHTSMRTGEPQKLGKLQAKVAAACNPLFRGQKQRVLGASRLARLVRT